MHHEKVHQQGRKRRAGNAGGHRQGTSSATEVANLTVMPQMSSIVLRKAIKSGIANAIFQSRNINPDTLWVKSDFVDKAPMLKRIRAASRGSADPILKRLSHITIVLSDDKKPEKKKIKSAAKKEESSKTAEV